MCMNIALSDYSISFYTTHGGAESWNQSSGKAGPGYYTQTYHSCWSPDDTMDDKIYTTLAFT